MLTLGVEEDDYLWLPGTLLGSPVAIDSASMGHPNKIDENWFKLARNLMIGWDGQPLVAIPRCYIAE